MTWTRQANATVQCEVTYRPAHAKKACFVSLTRVTAGKVWFVFSFFISLSDRLDIYSGEVEFSFV